MHQEKISLVLETLYGNNQQFTMKKRDHFDPLLDVLVIITENNTIISDWYSTLATLATLAGKFLHWNSYQSFNNNVLINKIKREF